MKDYLNYSQGMLGVGGLAQSNYHVAPLCDNVYMYLSSSYI